MKQIHLLSILLIITLAVYAQQPVSISKSALLEKVLKDNNSLKIGQQDVLGAQADYAQTRAVFLPNITASYTGISTTNPLMAFGSKLNQEILTQADFDPNALNNPSRIENFATKIEIQQPLLNLDGVFQRKSAKAKYNATQLQYDRSTQYITLETEKAYMQLQIAYKGVDVLETAKKAALENLKLAQNSYTQGYLQKADILAVQVRVSEVENQLQYAKSNIGNASNYLSVLMNDTTYEIYKPIDELEIETIAYSNLDVPKNRSDIQAMQAVTEAYEQQYIADKMTFLPRLNAFGSYELYDSEVFQADANGYLVGAQLSWNILEGGKRFGKTKKSKATFEKSKFEYEQYKANSQVELNRANRMLQDAKNNLKLTELSLEQAKEALRIRTNRFGEGLEKTSDLLLSETQYAQKQLEYYNTIYAYNYAQAYMAFLTSNK